MEVDDPPDEIIAGSESQLTLQMKDKESGDPMDIDKESLSVTLSDDTPVTVDSLDDRPDAVSISFTPESVGPITIAAKYNDQDVLSHEIPVVAMKGKIASIM